MGWMPSGQHGALSTFGRQQSGEESSQIKMTNLAQESSASAARSGGAPAGSESYQMKMTNIPPDLLKYITLAQSQQAGDGNSQMKMTGLQQDDGMTKAGQPPRQKDRIYFGPMGSQSENSGQVGNTPQDGSRISNDNQALHACDDMDTGKFDFQSIAPARRYSSEDDAAG
jgi:hypothetical protein